MLDILVEIDAQKHPQETEQADLETKTQREFDENQIDGQRRADPRRKIGGEDRLNSALRRHHSQNLP